MLSFKLALKEIFEAQMASSGKLEGLCDGVLGNSVAPLPKDFNKFITLGDYRISDARVGELKRKFREVEADIDCGAVVRAGKNDAEDDAEEASYAIALKVRSILKENKKLVSTTFSSGLAIVSEPLFEELTYVTYDSVIVALNTITYYIKMVEID